MKKQSNHLNRLTITTLNVLPIVFFACIFGCDGPKMNQDTGIPSSAFSPNYQDFPMSEQRFNFVGTWVTNVNYPGIGEGVSRYAFSKEGSVTGHVSIPNGYSSFIGTWQAGTFPSIQGKLFTVYGSSGSSIDHAAQLIITSSDELSIDGVIHRRQP